MKVQPKMSFGEDLGQKGQSIGSRVAILLFGLCSYAIGVVALLGLIGFSLGFQFLPVGGGRIHSPAVAALFNVGMLLAFAIQHSIMARDWFKSRWVKVIHPAMERSAFVLATGIALIPLLVFWQSFGAPIWSVTSPVLQHLIRGLGVVGWAYLFLASFAIHHFELFGLQQVWGAFTEMAPARVAFRERWMYRFDRHPIMTGVLVGIWATPELTQDRLLFNVVCSLYIAIGVHFEERALRRQWGEVYDSYSRRVWSIVPRLPLGAE